MADRKGHYRYENVTNLTDDFLRLKPTGSDDESWEINHCQICLGAFSDPRTLACMHTFCRECLQTAINQTSGGKKYDRGFRCVLCGYFTKVSRLYIWFHISFEAYVNLNERICTLCFFGATAV